MLVQGMMLSSSTVKLAVPVTIALKKNDPNIHQEDISHHTDIPGNLTACSFITFVFSEAWYMQLC